MSATIKDVAKLADVSISTVSRVINNSKPVSEDARKRVLEAVEELNYKPNQIARSLVTQKSNIIGAIVEDIGLSYVSQVLRGVEEIARMYDYDIIVSSTYGNPEMEDRYIKVMLQKQVEGIVVISESDNENRLDNIKNLDVPVMYLNRFYRNHDVSTVTISNKEAASKLVNYLTDKGHKKILYLGSSKDYDNTVERFKQSGYEEAMDQAGLEKDILSLEEDSKEGLKETGKLIIDKIKSGQISAIVCYCYESAINLMNILYDAGIHVPNQVSIVGIGDGQLAQTYRPRLTTIKEPLYDYGAVTIRTIIKNIRDDVPMPEERIILPSELLERESVKDLN